MLLRVLLAIAAVSATAARARGECEFHFFCGGYLEGRQVVPPVETLNEGLAILDGCFTELSGMITVSGPETVTAVHLHGPAQPEINGPLMRELPLPVAGVIRVEIAPLQPAEWDAIQGRDTYVDVHTLEHPDGAIRGRIEGEIAVAPSPWSSVKSLYR